MAHELSCKQLVDLVTEYMEETLPDDLRARFEQHLNECGYCTAFVEQMHQTITLTHQLHEDDVPPPAREELLKIFRDWKENKD